MNHWHFGKLSLVIAMIFAVTLAVSGCSGSDSGSGSGSGSKPATYSNVSAADVKKMLDSNEDIFLVDVHIPEQAHIEGTDTFIPFNAIGDNLGKLPADKNTKIVVYCRSGSMSQEASAELIKRGYANVNNMEGGIYAWKAAGYPLD